MLNLNGYGPPNSVTNEIVTCQHCGEQMRHALLDVHRREQKVCIVCMTTHETVYCKQHSIWLCHEHMAGHQRAAHIERGSDA